MQLSEDMDYRVKNLSPRCMLPACQLLQEIARSTQIKRGYCRFLVSHHSCQQDPIVEEIIYFRHRTSRNQYWTGQNTDDWLSLNWKVQCKLIGMKRYQLSYPGLEPDYYNTDLPGDVYTLVQCWYDCLWRQPPTIFIGLHTSMHKRKFIPSTPNFIKTNG